MRIVVAAWLVASASCHWASGGFGGGGGGGGGHAYEECVETQRPSAARTPPPPEPHPDFARLLAYRSYFSLRRVGAYQHHFAVFFNCIEESVDDYAVAPDGTVTREGGAWGGMAGAPAHPPPVPPEQQANARRVAARHAADYRNAGAGEIVYLGSYREVVVDERLPVSLPGDPYARMMWHATVTLRASEDLTSVDGKLAGMEGGETRMCWRDFVYVPCDEQRWIDVAVPPSGTPQLAALVRDDSPASAAARVAFRAAVLAAARAPGAGAKLDDLLARDGTSLLPPHLAPAIRAGFAIQPARRAGEPESLQLPLAADDAVHGTARASARATIAGVLITAEVEAAAVPPLPPDARGAQKVTLHVRYRVAAGAAERTAEVDADADVIVDGDSVVVTSLTWPKAATDRGDQPPLAQTLPAGGATLDVRFGASIEQQPWWGP